MAQAEQEPLTFRVMIRARLTPRHDLPALRVGEQRQLG